MEENTQEIDNSQEYQEQEATEIENDFEGPEYNAPEENVIAEEHDYQIPTTEDGEYDFDNMSEEQLQDLIDSLESDDDEDSEDENGYKLPDKFNDVESLVKSYQMLESKMGNFVKAPDQYEIEGIDMSSPLMTELSQTAKELNMSNDAFSKLISKHNEVQSQLADINIQNEMASLGAQAETRIENINNYIDTNLAPHTADAIRNMATSADSIAAIEALIQNARPSAPTTAPRQAASQDPKDMMWAKDEYGQLKMESDPSYAKMVNERLQAYYGN